MNIYSNNKYSKLLVLHIINILAFSNTTITIICITNLNSDISEPAPSKHLPQASLASGSKLPLLGSIASRTQEEPMIRGEFKSSSEEAAKLVMLESRRKVRWNSILMLKSTLNKTGPLKAGQPLIYSQST